MLTIDCCGGGRRFERGALDRMHMMLGLVGMADAALASRCPVVSHHVELDALTSREREVARLIRTGLPNKGIAALLGTSVETVRKQTARIYRKLGLSGRVHLLARFGAALASGEDAVRRQGHG
jgi:DNA-binding NarL/FixJ family response regulator